ncbi:hypothetical protein EGW08_019696 [Elysia chlorotica]|uniref:Uncharacterized protein n=1 Tax=Elysia chlorotica TaxID=188477 RepID=A0A433STF5_ELYCH|nr:hypothetical protein EGW08_019696 [Elysia chlorotica]
MPCSQMTLTLALLLVLVLTLCVGVQSAAVRRHYAGRHRLEPGARIQHMFSFYHDNGISEADKYKSHGIPTMSRIWQHIKLSDISLEARPQYSLYGADENKNANDENKNANDENKNANDENKNANDENKNANDENKNTYDENKNANDENKNANDENKNANDENKTLTTRIRTLTMRTIPDGVDVRRFLQICQTCGEFYGTQYSSDCVYDKTFQTFSLCFNAVIRR